MSCLLFSCAQKALLCLLVCCFPLSLMAQVRCVVIDKETGVPVRDVKACTDVGGVFTSDYQGNLVIDTIFHSAVLRHGSYLERKVEKRELRDTLWLLPKAIKLEEVVVWGEARKGVFPWMSIVMAQAAATATPPPGGVSFDFFEMFRKKPLSKKARKKNEQVLKELERMEQEERENTTSPLPYTP
ncbi:MAG: hypothetical protein J5548_10025 [Prevotella sp.]|nr:hypothetical protein [Prevotella sp.]